MNLIQMLCENCAKDREDDLYIGCSNSVLIGPLKEGANVGCESHFVCNLISLKQEICCLP
jgi:hypothetical protein